MIDSFYADTTILIAGSTGFCGKVLLEKLLFALPQIRRIFLLIRPRKGNTIEERCNTEILDSPCFARLHERDWDQLKRKITPIGWDLGRPGLILSADDEASVLQSVDIVFNTCATSDYSLPLDHVLQVNTLAPLSLLSLARRAAHVKAFVHLSTAFVNIDKPEGWIQEKVYTIEKDPKAILKEIMSKTPEQIEKDAKNIMGKLLNKALYTRWLADLVLQEESKSFPMCIVRPSIIGAALNEPFPGWIDTILGAAILYLSTGLGINNVAVGKLHKTSDQIPIDLVVNTMICASALYCKPSSPLVVHAASGSRNPVTWDTCKKIVTATWRKFPPEKAVAGLGIQLTSSVHAYRTYVAVTKKVPLYLQYAAAKIFRDDKIKKDAMRAEKALKREELMIKTMAPFALNEWIFSTQNAQNMIRMMSKEENMRFELDPAVIDWKIYLANFICGIKKYVLQEPIHNSLKAESMDLNWDVVSSKYFSDLKWALEKGSSVNCRPLTEMRALILNSLRVQNKISELAAKDPNKAYQQVTRELNNQAKLYLNSIFADMKMPVVRLMAWVLKKVWRAIYEKIVVDENALNKLKRFIATAKAPVIIVPSHRSYIDFFIVSYVFFAYMIKVPYVTSSDKFASIPIVHTLLKLTGSFFIKHQNLKDELFAAIFTEYVHQLLKDNHLVEFFIEGFRSRSGKILHPKDELLSICATAFFEGEVSDIHFVPVTISYDRVIESETFPLELLGETKERESLFRIINGIRILKQSFGRVHISICEPLSLAEFGKQRAGNKQIMLKELAMEIVLRLQDTAVIMPTNIIAAVLLMNRRLIGEDELISKSEWVREEILARGYKVSGFDKGSGQIAVKEAINLINNVIIYRRDLFNNKVSVSTDNKKILILSYYANSLQHVFMIESIIACTLYSFGELLAWDEGVPISRVVEEASFLSQFLKLEFVSRTINNTEKAIDSCIEFIKKRGVIEEFDGKIRLQKTAGMAYVCFCSLLWPVIDTYWSTLMFCSAICKNQAIKYEKLQTSVQWFVENMWEERTLSFYESCSLYSIKHALKSYEKMGILKSEQKKQDVEVTLEAKYIENGAALEELLEHIARFRKMSMVRKVGAYHELRRAILAEFPKL
jgi:glycerol-3-phosphate O-acyltransferase/nucleoside-diphosphate-sugar epimerase